MSGAIAAHVGYLCPRDELYGPAAKPVARLSGLLACPESTSFISDTNRLEWNERKRTASFHSNHSDRSNKVEIS